MPGLEPYAVDREQILENAIETLKTVIAPELTSDWAQFSCNLLIGALQYANGLARDDHFVRHREELQSLAGAATGGDPFTFASERLLAARRGEIPEAEVAALRATLLRQLDESMAASMPLLAGFARNMRTEPG